MSIRLTIAPLSSGAAIEEHMAAIDSKPGCLKADFRRPRFGHAA